MKKLYVIKIKLAILGIIIISIFGIINNCKLMNKIILKEEIGYQWINSHENQIKEMTEKALLKSNIINSEFKEPKKKNIKKSVRKRKKNSKKVQSKNRLKNEWKTIYKKEKITIWLF